MKDQSPPDDPSLENAGSEPNESRLALRESEEHFSQLVSGVRDYAVFLLDQEGRVLTWNSGAEQIKGYRAEEIIGRNFSQFYSSEAISSGWPRHELEVAGQTGRFEDEGWRFRKDGTRFWANVVITALRNDDGTVRGFIKITRDLTDRKQAEEKLRLSEERFRLLVEGVSDYAIFMLDTEGRVITWNTGAERLKGYSASRIIGRHFSVFYPEEAKSTGWPEEELKRAAETGRFEDEGWRIREDGSRFWANVVISALRDDRGGLQGYAKITRDLTDRKEAEEKHRRLVEERAAREAAEASAQELARQREQLRITLASIGDGVIVTDDEGRVTFLNSVAQELTGWPLAVAKGEPLENVFPIVHEETRQPVHNPALTALRERRVVALANHTILLARDGREIPIEDSAAPIVGTDGTISGAVLVFRDVTEARRALEARLYLAAIVESSDDAIIGKTLEGRIASWNSGAERLYGYSSEEIVGQPLDILIPPDHSDELPKIMGRIKRGERIANFETERVHKDGHRIPVSLTISPVRNRDGKIVGASKIARDITQQKRYQAALMKHTQRFRLLWESAAVLLSTDVPEEMLQGFFAKIAPHLRLDTLFTYLLKEGSNKMKLASYAGVCPEEVAEVEGLFDICGPTPTESQSEVFTHIQQSRDERTVVARRLGLRCCYCTSLVVEGRLFGTLVFGSRSRDDFEQDELEFLSTLARYVTVAYERLRLVEQLKEADRRKDHFLATLAHELRNPLAPLRNGLQVIKLAGLQEDSIRHAHQVMDRQLNHMVRLIDDLLDMSRISRGKITLRLQRVDVAEVVHSAVETSRPLIEAGHHRLEISLPAEPLWVNADSTRLAQVVSNLLNNAAKFTPDGGKISVRVDSEQDLVVLSVKDNGVGIPAGMQNQVFEVFTQVDRSLERSQGGLGIGLSLVKGLVELHGGRVQVRSDGESQGAEFLAYLPMAGPEPEEEEPPEEQAKPQEEGGLKILVVDDNQDSAMTLGMMLRMMSHEVRQAYDGVQAVRAAAEYRPDLVLMDIGMPELNGYDACRLMRQEPWGGDLVIVALTGWGQAEDKRKSREAGFDKHLVKPVEPAALEQLVAEVMERSAGPSSEPSTG